MLKTIILISVPVALFGFAYNTFAIGAISTDQDYYLPEKEIFFTVLNPKSEGANILLYNTETGKLYASCENGTSLIPTRKVSESCSLSSDFSKLAGLPLVGKHSLVVDTSGTCEAGLNYTQCKNQNGFSSEAKFSISSITPTVKKSIPAPALQKQVGKPGPTVQTEIDKTMPVSVLFPADQTPVAGRSLNFIQKLVIWLISPLWQISWRQ